MKKFEERLEKLEKISDDIRSSDIPLEKALSLFEEGIKLAKGLEKDIEKTQKELDKVLGKLSNEAFLAKAPQAVVDKENAIKEELETKIAKFMESINLYK